MIIQTVFGNEQFGIQVIDRIDDKVDVPEIMPGEKAIIHILVYGNDIGLRINGKNPIFGD